MGREVRRVPANWQHPVRPEPKRRTIWQDWPLRATAAGARRADIIDMVEQADGAYGVPRMLGSGQWDPNARHVPLLGGSYAEDVAEWESEWRLYQRGEHWHWRYDEGINDWIAYDMDPLPEDELESIAGLTGDALMAAFVEWHGARPDPEDYMPDWPEEERTHYQMYETTSEGTPISPVFATPEELARWCADNGASAFADMTMSYEEWLAVAGGRSTAGALVDTATGEWTPA